MTSFGLRGLCGHRFKLRLVKIYLFPLCFIPLKKSLDMQGKYFKVIITARDYTNRSRRVDKQYFIAQRRSSTLAQSG